MRISTGQLFDSGIRGIGRNQSELFRLQEQISSGRRMLTPKDDPIASSQALLVSQAKEVNALYMENQGNAASQLGLLDSNLESLGDLLQHVRERTIQLGNPALSGQDRASIAGELQSRFEELMGLANAQNGEGQYLYSGFQGATQPFAVNPNVSATFFAGNPAANYFGDEGERLLQVAASRQMSVSVSGADVFTRIRDGNGAFAVATAGNVLPGLGNGGSATAGPGTVLDISKWDSAPVQPQDYRIQFRIDATGPTPVTYYNLIDFASGSSMFTNAAPSAGPPFAAEWKTFTPGQAIPFSGLDAAFGSDLGAQVMVSGDPADGDQFSVRSSRNQSLFDTVKNLIAVATQTQALAGSGNTELTNDLGEQLTALDQGLDNVLRVRASVGSRMAELDSLKDLGADLGLQYSTRLSDLQDLDYAKAISDLTRQQMQLEAAQKTFVRVTGLSLFDILG